MSSIGQLHELFWLSINYHLVLGKKLVADQIFPGHWLPSPRTGGMQMQLFCSRTTCSPGPSSIPHLPVWSECCCPVSARFSCIRNFTNFNSELWFVRKGFALCWLSCITSLSYRCSWFAGYGNPHLVPGLPLPDAIYSLILKQFRTCSSLQSTSIQAVSDYIAWPLENKIANKCPVSKQFLRRSGGMPKGSHPLGCSDSQGLCFPDEHCHSLSWNKSEPTIFISAWCEDWLLL